MVAGSVPPDPWASGPEQPQSTECRHSSPALWGLHPPDLPDSPTSPCLDPRKPCRALSLLGTRQGAEQAGKLSPRGEGRAPQVHGRRPPAPAQWNPTHTPAAPSPPAGRGPLPDGLRAPSGHRGDASPPPPPPLRTSGDQPLSPKARPGSGPLLSLGLLRGAQWPAPHGGPTLDSTQATGTDKNKNRIGTLNGGEQDMRPWWPRWPWWWWLVWHCLVSAPLLRGTGVRLIWCVSASKAKEGSKKKRKKAPGDTNQRGE